MINYTNKGIWLHDEIEQQGYEFYNLDGTLMSSNDIAVQAIIDSFNPLPYAQAEAKRRITISASKKVADIYPFVDPESEQAIGLYNFAEDLYTSIHIDSRNALSGRLLEFKSVYDIATSGISDVNTETDWENCQSVADTTIVQIESL